MVEQQNHLGFIVRGDSTSIPFEFFNFTGDITTFGLKFGIKKNIDDPLEEGLFFKDIASIPSLSFNVDLTMEETAALEKGIVYFEAKIYQGSTLQTTFMQGTIDIKNNLIEV